MRLHSPHHQAKHRVVSQTLVAYSVRRCLECSALVIFFLILAESPISANLALALCNLYITITQVGVLILLASWATGLGLIKMYLLPCLEEAFGTKYQVEMHIRAV